MTDLACLTPIQQRVAAELLDLGGERPIADLSWAPDLAQWIDDELRDHSPLVGPRQRWVSKGSMSGALGCEAHYLATKDDFEWSIEVAKGTVVHHAIALAAAGSNAAPRDLAHAALRQASTKGSRSLGAWLAGLPDEDRVALVGEAVVGIDSFRSAFPSIRAGWHPVAEYPVSTTIAAGKVRVSGRVDLSLGSNRSGPEGIERRRMLLEIKTGRPRGEHRSEHLLYALLELLRTGVAPWRAATYYTLDSTWVADDITEEVLDVAAGRLVAATRKLLELDGGRAPNRQAGWRCAFCPVAETCPERVRPDGSLGDADVDW
jgi:hypothetical protein